VNAAQAGGLALVLAVALGGCQAIPDEGPSTAAIAAGGRAAADRPDAPFVVVDLTAQVARILARAAPAPAAAVGLPAARGVGAIGPGDLLHVTLWQADAAGGALLDHAAVELNVRVDPDGTVSVPYAGRVRVAGARPAAAEQALVAPLGAQTVAPQASVLVAEDVANSVIVEGEIARPGRVTLTPQARRLSDAIALAGGARLPEYQVWVSVERAGSVLRTSLADLDAPGADLVLAPGDRVRLGRIDRHFFAFGAVNRPGVQAYTAARMTLADALGQIAGLQDGRANPAGLFVFRRQPAALTQALLTRPAGAGSDLTQVVYRIDLRDPAAFFVLGETALAPRDVVYVSNAPLAELGKFASIVAGLSSVAATPRNFGAY
jgi:polysaccharide export outer membrane protein